MRRTRVRTRRPKRKMLKHTTRKNMSKYQKRKTGKRCKTCQKGG